MKQLTYKPMRTYTSTRRMAQELADKLIEFDEAPYTMGEAVDLALHHSLTVFDEAPMSFASGFPGFDHDPSHT